MSIEISTSIIFYVQVNPANVWLFIRNVLAIYFYALMSLTNKMQKSPTFGLLQSEHVQGTIMHIYNVAHPEPLSWGISDPTPNDTPNIKHSTLIRHFMHLWRN